MRISDWSSDVCSSDLSPASNPGTVYSLEGCPPGPDSVCLSSLEVRGNLPGLDSPVAIVPAGSDGLGLSPGDFAGTQGLENKTTQILHLRSAEKSYGINVTGRIDLSPSLEAFTELTYTKRSRSEEHTSELQSLMRISYAVFCLKKKTKK